MNGFLTTRLWKYSLHVDLGNDDLAESLILKALKENTVSILRSDLRKTLFGLFSLLIKSILHNPELIPLSKI